MIRGQHIPGYLRQLNLIIHSSCGSYFGTRNSDLGGQRTRLSYALNHFVVVFVFIYLSSTKLNFEEFNNPLGKQLNAIVRALSSKFFH